MKTISLLVIFFIAILSFNSPTARAGASTAKKNREEVAIISSVWTPNEETRLICWVRYSESAPTPELVIDKVIQGKEKRIFSTVPGDNPLSMFASSDLDPKLITVWTTGSAYMIRVYTYDKDAVKEVLTAGSKMMPEFVYSDKGQMTNDQMIVISNLGWVLNKQTGLSELKPVSADIYRWKGKSYTVEKNVPWSLRLTK